jgi:hypothetical protein
MDCPEETQKTIRKKRKKGYIWDLEMDLAWQESEDYGTTER